MYTTKQNKIDNVLANVGRNENPGRLIRPKYQQFVGPWGVDALDPGILINGTRVFPTFRYKMGDADATDLAPWTYGETLTLQAGTAPSYNQGSPGLGPNDDSVKGNGGGYYLAGNNSFGDITTQDVWFSTFFRTPASSSGEVLFHHKDAGNIGWQVILTSGMNLRWQMEDATAVETNITTSALNPSTWYFAELALNRDEASANSSEWHINGVAEGVGLDITGADGTLTVASPLGFLARGDNGANPATYHVAYAALYLQASWHQAGAAGPAEWATIAAERYAKLCGRYPWIAHGSRTPTAATRAYSAYIDKYVGSERKLFYMPSEWLRCVHRKDLNGASIRGYLIEEQSTNILSHSEEISVGFTKLDSGDTVTDADEVCPDGRTAAASLIADSTDGSHGHRIQPTLTAATYTFSTFEKPGNNNWVCLFNNTVAGCSCYFNVSTGAKGTQGVGCTGYIEGPFYNGYYRISIVFTGTAAVHDLRIYSCSADNDLTFAGDGSTKNMYTWNAQCEQKEYMSSPIRTSGATATRLGESLQMVAGDNIGGEDRAQGTIRMKFLASNQDLGVGKYAYWIGDGAASADRYFGFLGIANDDLQIGTRANAGNNGDASSGVDIYDGYVHTLKHTFKTNDTRVYIDGEQKGQDTSCDMPDDIDTMNIGRNAAALLQPNAVISEFEIYDEPLEDV